MIITILEKSFLTRHKMIETRIFCYALKIKGKKFVPHQKKRKLSAVSPEVLFAQKLAANDPVQRNRAVKKLQKWLQLRGALLTKEEIMRIWKGLHYCFWMSDKPLVQEELAETIGEFFEIFSN